MRSGQAGSFRDFPAKGNAGRAEIRKRQRSTDAL